ncbi:MAG: hypothetical protein U9Q83_07995 [Bacteroidota bacterium]|nr:hypothetical protein [Bacteroidota bacterium]
MKKTTNLTIGQTNHELLRITENTLTLEEYIRTPRVGETFRMNRADRKEVYALYLEDEYTNREKRVAIMMKNRKTTNLTKEQTNYELTKLRVQTLSFEDYFNTPRVSEPFKMNGRDKKEVYLMYLEEMRTIEEKREAGLIRRNAIEGMCAYDKITKFQDEVLLFDC